MSSPGSRLEQTEGVDGLRLRKGVDGICNNSTEDSCTESDDTLQLQAMLNGIKSNATELHDSFVEHVDFLSKKLVRMMDELVNKLDKVPASAPSKAQFNYTSHQKKKHSTQELACKEFISRRSLLTELFESTHIQTIYHIFIAILILLFLNTVVYDFVDTGKIKLDFELMQYTFGNVHIAMTIWFLMQLSTVLILYPGFHFWAYKRQHYSRFFDYVGLTSYILYLCLFLYLPVSKVIENDLPPASSAIVLCEQVRFVMKMHAFVRSNVSRALKYIPNKDKEKSSSESACPDFSKYLYFLFAPTLVYQDQYPRSVHISWNYVFSNFLQVVGCLFYTYFIFVRFCIPVFHKFGREPMSPKNVVLSVFGSMLPSVLVLLCLFFAILHSWLNAFAEMLKFADRMFYKDWWNSTTFANYYRTWNVVVHDWLYTYVYKDFHTLLKGCRGARYVPKIGVFVISALVHEYILALIFRFCYPVLFVMFGIIGMMFVFVAEKRQERLWNVLMWLALCMGLGLLMSLYSMEFYARINCPLYADSVLDVFIPRSWMCDAIGQN